jgi:hypothetical protein
MFRVSGQGFPQSRVQADSMRRNLGFYWLRKLVPSRYAGTRDAGAAYHFIHDLKDRLANRVQLTTDGHKAYLSPVEDAFAPEKRIESSILSGSALSIPGKFFGFLKTYRNPPLL